MGPVATVRGAGPNPSQKGKNMYQDERIDHLARRLAREAEAFLKRPEDVKQALAAPSGGRMNPRLGTVEGGVLCHLCAAQRALPSCGEVTWLACGDCWRIDQRVARELSLPFVLPLLSCPQELRDSPAGRYAEALESPLYAQIAEVQEDPDLLVEWRIRLSRAIARRAGILQWPDVGMGQWAECVPARSHALGGLLHRVPQ